MPTTRYYLGDSSTAPVSVAWSSVWFTTPVSSTTPRRLLTPVAPATSSGGNGNKPASLPNSTAILKGTSAALAAGPISGTFRLVIPAAFIGISFLRVRIRLVSNDGLTVRAVLADVVGEQIVNGSTPATRLASGALTPATAVAGDRYDVEIGANVTSGLGGSIGLSGFSGTATTDYAYVTNQAVPANTARPWIEMILDDPPLPPTGLVQTSATATTVGIDWTAPATGAVPTSYEYRVDGGAAVNVALATDALLTGLAPGTTYAVQVRTIAATGSSAWSAALLVDTLDPIPPDRRYWTQRLASALGLDPIESQPVVEVRTYDHATDTWNLDADLSNGLTSYTITHGRRTAAARTEPMAATLGFATARLPATPAIATRLQVALSDAVAAALGLDPDDAIRFTGEVTDPVVDHDARRTSLTCVGRLARALRRPVDGTLWPVEDDGARIAHVLAGIDVQAGTIDAGTVDLAAPARLDLAAKFVDQTTASSLGQLVEQPDGDVDWHDAEHRRGTPVHMTLAASRVLRRVTWSQRLDSLVNDLDVKTAAGAIVTVTDTESSDPARYGPWPAAVDTVLTTILDAYGLGLDIVGRRADPSWQLPDLTVNLIRTIPLGDLADVLTLRHASLLELTGLPAACPVPGKVYVEGWTETATPRVWSLQVNVSDPLQSGTGLRWIDWPDTDAYQWQDLDIDLTWLDLARITDPADTL